MGDVEINIRSERYLSTRTALSYYAKGNPKLCGRDFGQRQGVKGVWTGANNGFQRSCVRVKRHRGVLSQATYMHRTLNPQTPTRSTYARPATVSIGGGIVANHFEVLSPSIEIPAIVDIPCD